MGRVLIETQSLIVVTKMHCCSAFLDTGLNDGDHHWYRLDNNGQWSHKPNETHVKQTDNGENPIVDPRVSNNGDYQFAFFMISDPLTIHINGDFVCPV